MRKHWAGVGLRTAAVVLVAAALIAGAPSGAARPFAPKPIPIPLDRDFLSNLSAPSIAPGASTTVGYRLADPARLVGALSHVVLTFQVYAFNGYPGDATAQLPVANAPVLSNGTASGTNVTVRVASVPSGGSVGGSIGLATSSATPAGTFAIRTALTFELNGSGYRLASRGWFTAAVWDRATETANGSATLNLSVLGVAGVLPETAVLVASSDWAWALGALLAGAFVLLAAGAWVYSRRGPGSTSGAG